MRLERFAAPIRQSFPNRRSKITGKYGIDPLTGADEAALRELLLAAYGGGEAEEEWHRAIAPWNQDLRFGARTPGGELVGFAGIYNERWMEHVGRRRVQVAVHPGFRRQGVGEALFRHALETVRPLGLSTLEAQVCERREEGVAFLQRRGFVESERVWHLALRPRTVGRRILARALENAARQGITLTTLAEEWDGTDVPMRQFHALWVELARDQPDHDPRMEPPVEAFLSWLQRPGQLQDACFIARVGEEYVATSMATRRACTPEVLFQNLTGTVAAYRRRGLATALKARVIDYARKRGYHTIHATNDSRNVAMLALNERLGFRRTRAVLTLVRKLGGSD